MRKKVLVVCGNGIASSSIMVSMLEDYFKEVNIDAEIEKASLIDLRGDASAEKINSKDLVVSSTKIDNENITTKVIIGIGLLTGIGEDEVLEAIRKELS
ncbi:MAG: hypothetical protein ACQEXV_19070 [Bacillota bacterium]|uniref:PTS galactitol transporter subunit IIB n=1 Tax=Paenibacillus maysiensis TaxID=1155954 RepID=UPI000470DA1F|nr:PTS galactitol transporter subunit IIB [Paenibacillus maysiensis]